MDGTQALKFVRSRHAEGVEGSDFSRNKRQQKVIEALQKKIVSLVKSLDVNQYKKFYEVINNSVKRDISNQQLALLVKKSLFSQHFSQKEAEIPQSMFIVPQYDQYNDTYVLIPKEGSFTNIHDFVKKRAEALTQ